MHQCARQPAGDVFEEYTLLCLQVEECNAADAAAFNLAAFLFYTHSFERARAILERQLQPGWQQTQQYIETSSIRIRTLLGFVLLQQQAQEVVQLQDLQELQLAHQLFEGVLLQDAGDLEVCCHMSPALAALAAFL